MKSTHIVDDNLLYTKSINLCVNKLIQNTLMDFFGGAVNKNSPANAGDMGSIPGAGRFHTQWSS